MSEAVAVAALAEGKEKTTYEAIAQTHVSSCYGDIRCLWPSNLCGLAHKIKATPTSLIQGTPFSTNICCSVERQCCMCSWVCAG